MCLQTPSKRQNKPEVAPFVNTDFFAEQINKNKLCFMKK